MFYVRLTKTFDPSDSIHDIQLPDVPAVGDTIEVQIESGTLPMIYTVKARRFSAFIHGNAQLIHDQPFVTLQVGEVKAKSGPWILHQS